MENVTRSSIKTFQVVDLLPKFFKQSDETFSLRYFLFRVLSRSVQVCIRIFFPDLLFHWYFKIKTFEMTKKSNLFLSTV